MSCTAIYLYFSFRNTNPRASSFTTLPFGHCIFTFSYCISEIKIRSMNTTVTEKPKIFAYFNILFWGSQGPSHLQHVRYGKSTPGVMCGQHIEFPSCCLSRSGLPLQISSNPNSSWCLFTLPGIKCNVKICNQQPGSMVTSFSTEHVVPALLWRIILPYVRTGHFCPVLSSEEKSAFCRTQVPVFLYVLQRNLLHYNIGL